jgi:hypothetical protein
MEILAVRQGVAAMKPKNELAKASPRWGTRLHHATWFLLLLALFLVPSAGANAQQVPPGVIVYSHEDSGSPDPSLQFSNIWSLDPQNPAQQTQITTFTGPPVFTSTPVWKKDFTQLAFNSNFNDGLASLEASSIYSMNPDGSNLAQITGFGVLNPLPPPTGTVVGRVQAPPTIAGAGDVSACVITVQGAPQNVPCLDGATFMITNVPVGSTWVRVQAQVSYPLTLGEPGLSLGFTPITVTPDAVTDAGTILVFPQIPKSIEPAWSRDGSQIIVTNEVSGKILRRNPNTGQLEWVPAITHQLNVWTADGQFVRAIPDPAGFEFIGSDWSPAADQICFASIGSSAGQSFVTVANPDGSNARNIYQVPIDFLALHFVTFCRWSPDGQSIAFIQSNVPAFGNWSSDLYIINADGSGLRRLTANQPGGFLLVPTWSPDSQAIGFQFSVGTNPLNFTSSDLWVIGTDGTCCVQLTTDGRSTAPTWGPPM